MSEQPRTADLSDRYATGLGDYLASGDRDGALAAAFSLGREAIDAGLGILDLCSVHDGALGAILAADAAEPFTLISGRAAEFLAESLAPFEMVHRGFRETNAAIQSLNHELQASVEELGQLAAIVEAADDAIHTISLDNTILSWNPAAERLYGYTASEAIGKSDDILVPKSLGRTHGATLDLIRQNESLAHFETIRAHKDGTPLEVSVTVSPIVADQGHVVAVAVIARDISERKRAEQTRDDLEKQLLQAQKLEAIGNLAGGIAHDFNNLLMVVQLSAAHLRQQVADLDTETDLQRIDDSVSRGTALTRQLLAFSHRQVLRPEHIEPNRVIENTLALLERLIGEDIELHRDLAPDVGAIIADPGQLGQVILNLAVNARDAMPSGGTLTISTRTLDLDQPYTEEHLEIAPGRYVLMQLTDTGTGMDEATRARVFEPFFTTKEQGTGFGLATVYGIVKQSGGYIWLYSELGIGTTFKIYLPLAANPLPAPSRVLPEITSLAGTETILLVEDDDAVRTLITRSVQQYGYQVHAARTPAEALAMAAESTHFDLLLTDVVMPGMNGRELAEALLSGRPALKILFTSGYPADTILRHGIANASAAYIEKPYLPSELATKLREVLASTQVSSQGPAASDAGL